MNNNKSVLNRYSIGMTVNSGKPLCCWARSVFALSMAPIASRGKSTCFSSPIKLSSTTGNSCRLIPVSSYSSSPGKKASTTCNAMQPMTASIAHGACSFVRISHPSCFSISCRSQGRQSSEPIMRKRKNRTGNSNFFRLSFLHIQSRHFCIVTSFRFVFIRYNHCPRKKDE